MQESDSSRSEQYESEKIASVAELRAEKTFFNHAEALEHRQKRKFRLIQVLLAVTLSLSLSALYIAYSVEKRAAESIANIEERLEAIQSRLDSKQ